MAVGRPVPLPLVGVPTLLGSWETSFCPFVVSQVQSYFNVTGVRSNTIPTINQVAVTVKSRPLRHCGNVTLVTIKVWRLVANRAYNADRPSAAQSQLVHLLRSLISRRVEIGCFQLRHVHLHHFPDLPMQHSTGWPKKLSYRTLSISSLNIDQFSHFSPVDPVRNLLLIGTQRPLVRKN